MVLSNSCVQLITNAKTCPFYALHSQALRRKTSRLHTVTTAYQEESTQTQETYTTSVMSILLGWLRTISYIMTVLASYRRNIAEKKCTPDKGAIAAHCVPTIPPCQGPSITCFKMVITGPRWARGQSPHYGKFWYAGYLTIGMGYLEIWVDSLSL